MNIIAVFISLVLVNFAAAQTQLPADVAAKIDKIAAD